MTNVEDVHRCLDEGPNALVHPAELAVTGERKRGEVYEQAQADPDALLGEARPNAYLLLYTSFVIA